MRLRDFTGILHKFDQITNCSISSCVKGRPRRFDKRIASRKRYTLPSEGSVSHESGISSPKRIAESDSLRVIAYVSQTTGSLSFIAIILSLL